MLSTTLSKDWPWGRHEASQLAETVSMHQSSDGAHAVQLAVEQDAWNAALARARGERILDDPKLLSRCAALPACLHCPCRLLLTQA